MPQLPSQANTVRVARRIGLAIGMVAIAAFPSVSDAQQTGAQWAARGRALIDSGKHDAAAKAFEQAVKLEPRTSSHHLGLAQALGGVAERAGVLRQPFIARRIRGELERARELDPAGIDPRIGLINYYIRAPGIMGGSDAKAHAEAAEIARISPLQGHLARAQIGLLKRDSLSAEREYRGAVAAFPDSAVAYTQLAGYLRRAHRDAEAFTALDQLLTRRPDDPVALYALGQFAAATGTQLDRGHDALQRYLRLPPPDSTDRRRPSPAVAHYWFGRLLQRQAREPEARAQFEAALRLNPDLEQAKRALAGR
jgi:tetratricopeptide (TPR) repeat protein